MEQSAIALLGTIAFFFHTVCELPFFVVFHCPYCYILRPVSNITGRIPFLVLC